ncbi:MAG: hypothetical protein ABIQ53_14305, partial [Terracoccus sp.]
MTADYHSPGLHALHRHHAADRATVPRHRSAILVWDQITSIVTWLRRPPKVVPSDTEGARMSP